MNQIKESEEKLRADLLDLSRRHKVLLMRLTTRERQLVETEAQISELKKSITPNAGALRSTLLDPAVNLIVNKMKKELEETKKKLEDTQNDLNAWKFTPDRFVTKRTTEVTLAVPPLKMFYRTQDLIRNLINLFIVTLGSDLWPNVGCYIKRMKT